MIKMFFALSLLSMFNGGFGWLSSNSYSCYACGYSSAFRSAPAAYYQGLGGNLMSLTRQLGSHMSDLTFELPGLIAEKTKLTTMSYFRNFSYADQMRLAEIDNRIFEMQNDSSYLRSYGASLAGVR